MLTARQSQVAELRCAGHRIKTVAYKLNLSMGTVKSHLVTIYKRISCSSVTELRAWRENHPQAVVPAKSRKKKPTREVLAPRQVEILRLMCTGLTADEIAQTLSISTRTVENQITSILKRTRCTGRVQLGIWADRHGHAPVALS